MRNPHEIFLEAAHPNLYRINAFRVAELPVDASTREISRQLDKIKMMEDLGLAVGKPGGPLPLDPPPDADAMREALQRLRDPERRLIDEFFWFWPHELGQSRNDPALAALAKKDLKTAIRIWTDQESLSSNANVSMHNLAVLLHTLALDWEAHNLRGAKLSAKQMQLRNYYWNEALKRWRLLADHEGFWSRVTARIRDLDDPRLTTGVARRIRDTMPVALVSINAQLAVRAAEQGNGDDAGRHAGIMQQSDFAREAIDEALHRAVEPIRGRIRTLCKAAEPEANADPVHADEVTRRLITQARPLLAVLDSVLPEGNPTREGAHDEAALCALTCQIQFGNQTENWRISLELLELASPIAASESARGRLEHNKQIVRRNLESGGDWCGEGYYDLPPPVLQGVEQARGRAKARKWDEAISILEGLLEGDAPGVRESDRPLVHKALAYCLNLRAVDRLNTVIRTIEHEVAQIPAMRAATDQVRKLIMANLAKTRLREAANAANRDLAEASELDPGNPAVDKNRRDLRELCSNAGITLEGIQTETVYAPQEVGRLDGISASSGCWFCGGARRPERSASVRVELHRLTSVREWRHRKTIKYKHGHVDVPRCPECQKEHTEPAQRRGPVRKPQPSSKRTAMRVAEGLIGATALAVATCVGVTTGLAWGLASGLIAFAGLAAFGYVLFERAGNSERRIQVSFALFVALIAGLWMGFGVHVFSREKAWSAVSGLGVGVAVFAILGTLLWSRQRRIEREEEAARRKSPPIKVQDVQTAKNHPSIRKLLQQGWKLGARPERDDLVQR